MEHKLLPIIVVITEQRIGKVIIDISLFHNEEAAKAHFLIACAEKKIEFDFADTREDWFVSKGNITIYLEMKEVL